MLHKCYMSNKVVNTLLDMSLPHLICIVYIKDINKIQWNLRLTLVVQFYWCIVTSVSWWMRSICLWIHYLHTIKIPALMHKLLKSIWTILLQFSQALCLASVMCPLIAAYKIFLCHPHVYKVWLLWGVTNCPAVPYNKEEDCKAHFLLKWLLPASHEFTSCSVTLVTLLAETDLWWLLELCKYVPGHENSNQSCELWNEIHLPSLTL